MEVSESLERHCLEPFQQSEDSLKKLSASCCLPHRSENILSLQHSLKTLKREIKTGKKEELERAISRLQKLGSKIGELHVTCCASNREKHYQVLLKQLNKIYENIQVALGNGH